MRFFRAVLVGLTLSLLVGTFLHSARADQWNKKTILTFSQPIEVPGKVLPAGTYTFKLLDSMSYRHVVQIWNEEGTQLITTILPCVHAGSGGDWVRNVNAAGGAVTLRHGSGTKVRLEEVPADRRSSLVKAYLKQTPGARPHLPIYKDEPLSEFARLAAQFPVFQVIAESLRLMNAEHAHAAKTHRVKESQRPDNTTTVLYQS